MIDPFEGIDSPDINRRTTKELRWLNIFGDNKTCKTSFLTSLQEKLRVIHLDFDCEGGTKMQTGTFLECPNLTVYERKIMLLFNNLARIRPHIIVVDPMDRFYDMLEAKYMADNNITSITWSQWGEMREILQTKIRKVMKLCPLFITTHSFRVSAMGKDTNKVTFQDMDIPSKIQKWVQGATDANLHFYWTTDAQGKEYPTFSARNIGKTDESMAGSRDEELYKMSTLDELRDYIVEQALANEARYSLKLAA